MAENKSYEEMSMQELQAEQKMLNEKIREWEDAYQQWEREKQSPKIMHPETGEQYYRYVLQNQQVISETLQQFRQAQIQVGSEIEYREKMQEAYQQNQQEQAPDKQNEPYEPDFWGDRDPNNRDENEEEQNGQGRGSEEQNDEPDTHDEPETPDEREEEEQQPDQRNQEQQNQQQNQGRHDRERWGEEREDHQYTKDHQRGEMQQEHEESGSAASLRSRIEARNTKTTADFDDFLKAAREKNAQCNKMTADSKVEINGKERKVGDYGKNAVRQMQNEARENGHAHCEIQVGEGENARTCTFDIDRKADGTYEYTFTDPKRFGGEPQSGGSEAKSAFQDCLFNAAKEKTMNENDMDLNFELSLNDNQAIRIVPEGLDDPERGSGKVKDGSKEFNFYLVEYDYHHETDKDGNDILVGSGEVKDFCQIKDQPKDPAKDQIRRMFNENGLTADDMHDMRIAKLNREQERKETEKAQKKAARRRSLQQAEEKAKRVAGKAVSSGYKWGKDHLKDAVRDGADWGGMGR